jgi:hypothetical protein
MLGFSIAWVIIGERGVVPLAGIEPATSGSTIRRSNHLSYNGTPSGEASNKDKRRIFQAT